MDSKPLGYDSLKVILQYMDANKRFKVSQRIPITRTADRVTPLFINTLCFNGYSITVNNVKHTLRVSVDDRVKTNDRFFKYMIRCGGFSHDLDQFGLEDSTTEATVTPGDLVNEAGRRLEITNRNHEMRFLERQVENQKKRKNENKNDKVNYELGQGLLANYEARLIPHYNYQENRPLLYENIIRIQYYCTSSVRVVAEERLSYNKKLPEAMKYLTTKLFGNHLKHPIKVRRLENVWNCGSTIRLPVNFKMEVREMNVSETCDAKQLLPVIGNSKVEVFRLKSVDGVDLKLELLRTAEVLVIDSIYFNDWMPIVQNLQNQKAFLMGTNISSLNNFNNYTLLMKHWIENGKEVGTCFSFGFGLEYTANKVRNTVMEEFGGLTLTMNNQYKIVVSIEEMSSEWKKKFVNQKWLMKMEVVE